MIRRKFEQDLLRRFRKLKAHVREFIVELDALGLKEKKLGLAILAQRREYEFRTDAGKLKAFNDWFRQQVEADIFSLPPGANADEPWTTEYIESAYKKGHINAYLASRRADLLEEDITESKFLADSFNQPEAMSKVRLLGMRTYEELRGVTATMGAQLNTILAQGMVDGLGATAIARAMTDKIDSLSYARALMIARTEIINAHSEGQLDAYEKLGVDELGLQVEWSTAGDDRVCEQCSARAGEILTVDEARGIIPLHPNCRCAWLPALAGLTPEPKKKK